MGESRSFPAFLSEADREFFELDQWLGQAEAFQPLVLAQWLYVPDFVEYRGGVFALQRPGGLDDEKRKRLDVSLDSCEGNVARAEWLANLIEFYYFFGDDVDIDAYCREIAQIAGSVRDCWAALLAVQFPDRRFDVTLTENGEDGPWLSFYTVPSRS